MIRWTRAQNRGHKAEPARPADRVRGWQHDDPATPAGGAVQGLRPGRPNPADPVGRRRTAMIKYFARHLDEGEKHRRWIDPRLYSVQPEDLRAYLLHKGWKEVPSDRSGFLVFEEPVAGADGPLYQFVPEHPWEGYPAQVYE